MFNTAIPYTFILTFNNPKYKDIVLIQQWMRNWERPFVGGQIFLKGKKYKVISANPSNNPDDQSVTYTVEQFNPQAPYRRGPQKMRLKYKSTSESDNLINYGSGVTSL